MAVQNLNDLEAYYAIALELEDYRRASHIAIRAMKRAGVTELWKTRLHGCLAKRWGWVDWLRFDGEPG